MRILGEILVALNRFTEGEAHQAQDEQNKAQSKAQSPWIKRQILKILRMQMNAAQRWYDAVDEKLSKDYFYGNFSMFLFLSIYLAVSMGLFLWVIIYRIQKHTYWLAVIARICGMQLNFNCALMLVLMLRNTARVIRSSRRLYALIPVDETVTIHARIGRWIAVLAFVHTLCHLINAGVNGNGE